MQYEVTAIKKRPQNFDELAGQDFVSSTLRNSILTGRIAHAYLFSGPRGVGKTSAARIFAKAINCQSGPNPEPCGKCESCLSITQGNSFDVIEIDGASNTSVNDIREIKEEVLFAPTKAKYKIYIIDEVHMLSNSAFNALLKTIEEPPPYIIFIFATTEIHKVPATIKSRCQQFQFKLLSVDQIIEKLKKACDEMTVKYEEKALLWIAKEATGSMRDGYTLFDQIVSFAEGSLTLEKIRAKLGLAGTEKLNQLVSFCFANNLKEALELIHNLFLQGISLERLVFELTEHFRNILLIKTGISHQMFLGFDAGSFNQELIEGYEKDQLIIILNLLFDFYKNLKLSLQPRYEFELLIAKISSVKNYISSQEILTVLKSMANASSGETSVAQINEESKNEPQNSADSFSIENFKHKIIEEIKVTKPALGSFLESAIEWKKQNKILKLSFDKSYIADYVNQDISILNKICTDILGEPVSIKVDLIQKANEIVENTSSIDENLENIKKVFRGQIIEE